MTRKQANAFMRQKYPTGVPWYDRPGGKAERDALMHGAPLPKPAAKLRREKPKAKPTPAKKRTEPKLKIDVAGFSHQGPRDYQEDDFVASKRVVAVADGMGGHAAGDIASKLAIKAAIQAATSPNVSITRVIQQANASILEYGHNHPEARGLGTTLSMGLIKEHPMRLSIGHVGDSRVTLIQEGSIHQITDDHSLVGQLVKEGRITKEEARNHPHKNVILAALGHSGGNKPNRLSYPLVPGQVFLFTSDGVHDYMSDKQMLSIVQHNKSARHIAQAIVAGALTNDAYDNVTCVVLKVD